MTEKGYLRRKWVSRIMLGLSSGLRLLPYYF